MKAAGIWLVWWVFLFAVWMALVATQATAEVLAGIVVAAIAATAAEVVRRSGLVGLRPWGLLPRHPWRLPGTMIVRHVAAHRRAVEAAPRPPGQRRCVPRHRLRRRARRRPSGSRPPVPPTRRVISLTPNAYVIGIDRENDNMLVHELLPGPREETRERVLGKL